MIYNIIQKVASTSSSSTTVAQDYWTFILDSNKAVFASDNLDIIENKLKELEVSVPIGNLKVITDIEYTNDFIFGGTTPTQYTYTVNYYFDDVQDDTKTITGDAILGTVIILQDYSSTTYAIDSTKTVGFTSKLTIGLTDNTLDVYYKTI